MTMTPMLALIPEVAVDVPNCPNPIVMRGMRDTMQDFCRRSEAWIVRQDYGVTIAGFSQVTLDLPKHTRMVKILSLTHNYQVLHSASEKILDQQIWGWRKESGTPIAFFEAIGNKVSVYPIPTKTTAGELTGTIALAPTRHATEIDEDLWDNWQEGLVAGIQSRLMLMPDKSWTNPPLALALAEKYDTAVTHARRYSRNDHQVKTGRVTAYGGY